MAETTQIIIGLAEERCQTMLFIGDTSVPLCLPDTQTMKKNEMFYFANNCSQLHGEQMRRAAKIGTVAHQGMSSPF